MGVDATRIPSEDSKVMYSIPVPNNEYLNIFCVINVVDAITPRYAIV
jgi:hypothetical protein